MKEFKGTKGEWEIIEHSWSDTSIVSVDRTIASISIYDEATEETQEELEIEAEANAKLIAAAPKLLKAVQYLLNSDPNNGTWNRPAAESFARDAITKALK